MVILTTLLMPNTVNDGFLRKSIYGGQRDKAAKQSESSQANITSIGIGWGEWKRAGD